jgi:hypothetical protein
VNSHDLQRPSVITNPSYTGKVDENAANNHHDSNKHSASSSSKSDHAGQLTVIG